MTEMSPEAAFEAINDSMAKMSPKAAHEPAKACLAGAKT